MAETDTVEIKGDLAEHPHENPVMQTTKVENEEKRGSPPPLKALPMKPKDLQVPLPSSRPPSTTSLQSSSSNGAPPRTTTSRRGGRTRSRSPPTMSIRPGSETIPEREFAEALPPMESRNQSPANPSSAAAAAAAAAKAFSNNGNRNPNQWYEGAPEGSGQRERRPEDARYHPGYDKRYPGSRKWPGEEDSEGRRNHRSSRPREGVPDGRQYSQRGPYPADQSRSGSGSQGEGRHASSRRQYDQYGSEYDGRYQDSRGRGSFERDGSRGDPASNYEADRHHQRYSRRREEPEEYYRGPGGVAPVAQDAFSPKAGPRDAATTPLTAKRSGGTTRVIGTATPIHVPRAPEPSAGHHPPAGTPASVFRGRPGNDASVGPDAPVEQENPQNILLSLRTPTTSFEEQQHSRSRKEGVAPPLSPEEPPQIQHSHHQHKMDQSLFFDQPNRESPKDAPVQASTLEMAPSFSLFNQSFDSLGDTAQYLNVSEPLEGAFNSASFGVGPTASRDDIAAQLLPNPSGTNSFTQGDRFLGSSSAGMLTFGMSPVNSFGNGPPNNSARRNGNMMVLGGPDQRSTSPTQMLSMYPSYSGGYGSQGSGGQQGGPFRTRSGPMTEQPGMRTMSSGSFGASAMYSRSYEASPHGAYQPLHHDGSRTQDGPPGFYAFLGRNKTAFVKCSFLLPGLKAALLESPISDSKTEDDKSGRKLSLGGRRGRFMDPSPQDSVMSNHRVASAICAFGGSMMGDRANSAKAKDKDNKQSIFREKEDEPRTDPAVTVTPSSSSGTPPGTGGQQPQMKHKYDELLPSRYYENENRLSWEFEETPPVGDDEDCVMGRKRDDGDKDGNSDRQDGSDDPSRVLSSPQPNDPDKSSSSPTNEDDDDDDEDEDGKKGSSSDQPKMRYRCKLCGLPKQNHTCAYQQSLQRSIGIMIYPAVNAFTSSEPGMLAPALVDMNNFVSTQGESSSTETSPSRPTPDRARRPGQTTGTPGAGAPNVTPETMRSSNSSSSSPSVGARTPLRSPASQKRKPRGSNMSGGAAMGQRVGTGSPPGSSSRKRTHAQMTAAVEEDLLFVDTTDLKPEQFRIVTPSKKAPGPGAYTYPSLPLPYAQRKRLSDNLFALSKEVPQLTDECAVVLREARERDMWDQAVAELMTQVVVVIHCHDNDTRFEGLRHYLLTLGIAC